MDKIKAWHFAKDSRTLGYGDGRRISQGKTLSVKGVPQCCKRGLHGSVNILDALSFGLGTTICRVEIWGNIDKKYNKLCGTHREVLCMIDGKEILKKFARWCAFRTWTLWEMPEPVFKYLKTGNEAIRTQAVSALIDYPFDDRGTIDSSIIAESMESAEEAIKNDNASDALYHSLQALTLNECKDDIEFKNWDKVFDSRKYYAKRKLLSMLPEQFKIV